jgi:hypothetical protein
VHRFYGNLLIAMATSTDVRTGLAAQLCCATTVVCALAMLEGCGTNNGDHDTTHGDPIPQDWFAYFRLTQGDEAHLYIHEGWRYDLVPNASASGDDTLLPSEHRSTIEELFSNGLEDYESDSMHSSQTDMGECDSSADHPIVHIILINPEPLVGKHGFGCWSTDEDLSEATRMMIERMEDMLQSLTGEDAGEDAGT